MCVDVFFLLIREATEEDFGAILELSAHFWEHTEFDEPFEPEHTIGLVRMAHDHHLLAVVEQDDKIVGFAAGISSPLMGNSSVKSGTELAWWVEPDYRGIGSKLLDFMENLAKENGIKYWCMVSLQSCNPDYANRIYEKKGYRLSEMTYIKVL